MADVITLPWSRPLRRDDLRSMPDDGHRYELVDGALLVSPAPSRRHQRAVFAVAARLHEATEGTDLEMVIAPFDVVLADDTVVEPDVVLARRTDLTERDLPIAPVLVVEVLTPSTRRIDQLLKRSRYAAAGIAHYWIVDPDEPSLTAYELGPSSTYTEVAHVVGEDSYVAERPVPVTLVPAALVQGPR